MSGCDTVSREGSQRAGRG